MLSDFGDVVAFEPNRDAVEMAAAKGDYSIVQGALPDQIPLNREDFDLILALDVIEHVESDIEGLAALRKMLKPGGKLVLTVPAFPFLWSAHDRTHHHYRRYTRRSLVDKVNASGYELEYVTYYNFLLFPIVAATRFLKNWLALEDTGDERMPAPRSGR